MEKLSFTRKLPKIIGTIALWVIGALVFLAITRILFLNSLYVSFLDWISSGFGVDVALARPMAVFMTALSLLVFPWVTTYLLFGKGQARQRLTIATMIGSLVFLGGTYFITDNVYFDRSTGEYSRCYLKTLDGFKFSSKCDYDPEFGMKYEPITPAITKEIHLWEKSGNLQNIPNVQEGKYFDQLTGEPVVWYSINPVNGRIRLFPLPGYDPMTGERLKPMTKEAIPLIQQLGSDAVFIRSNSYFPAESFDLLSVLEARRGTTLTLAGTPYREEEGEAIAKATVRSWYHEQPQNVLQTEVKTIAAGDYSYSLSVEKVIFLKGYTVVGLKVLASPLKEGQAFESIKFSYQGSFLDSKNRDIKRKFWIIDGAEEYGNNGYGSTLNLNPGEAGSLIFVLSEISPALLRPALLRSNIKDENYWRRLNPNEEFLLRFSI